MCPASQIQFANKYGDILAQYGNSCYTVANYKASWEHAEDICQRHSGHLLHILNKDENDFITNLLTSQFSHSVWIGLHDIDREEHFKWTSGQLSISRFLLCLCLTFRQKLNIYGLRYTFFYARSFGYVGEGNGSCP